MALMAEAEDEKNLGLYQTTPLLTTPLTTPLMTPLSMVATIPNLI